MMSPDGLSSSVEFVREPKPNSNPNGPTSKPSGKRKRNLAGTPEDPDAEVIALSPKSLTATNRFMCEICNKGFQRDQNLQLHRRGHNLPWKLKQRANKELKKKVYLCPEESCVHHDPSRALGDLTGIKKHFFRKHGEKKWKCDKCSKKYAVQSDWKAHSKICGTREYKCQCGTLFCRKDSFITHRAFCDALTDESSKFNTPAPPPTLNFSNELINSSLQLNAPQTPGDMTPLFPAMLGQDDLATFDQLNGSTALSEIIQSSNTKARPLKAEELESSNIKSLTNSMYYNKETSKSHLSATALLQKATTMGSTRSHSAGMFANGLVFMNSNTLDELLDSDNQMMDITESNHNIESDLHGKLLSCDKGNMTRDFLGVGGSNNNGSYNKYSRVLLQQEVGKLGSDMDTRQYSVTGTNGEE
uniref:C2H2-type domain-containing protein n=1 Tax=Daucus carota subsp. sativus TaxID=79200 RepID=A0A162A586_DAUCS